MQYEYICYIWQIKRKTKNKESYSHFKSLEILAKFLKCDIPHLTEIQNSRLQALGPSVVLNVWIYNLMMIIMNLKNNQYTLITIISAYLNM